MTDPTAPKPDARDADEVPEPTPKVPDAATLGVATLFALFVAGVVLLLFVLPAEYGIDPTKFGQVTGISQLSDPGYGLELEGTGSIHRSEPAPPRNDTVVIRLDALADNEYKLHLLANQSLLYSWTASGPVDYDFHGEPDEPATPGEFASYEARQDVGRDGSFQAPFTGRHGWYFRNVGDQPVDITLRTWGYYDVVGLVG